MLTDEEIEYFLHLLLKFAADTGASGRTLSAVFNVSVKTMARWLLAAHGKESIGRMYYSRVNPVRTAIEKMNRANVKAAPGNKPYRNIARIAKVGDAPKKVEAIKALMEATA